MATWRIAIAIVIAIACFSFGDATDYATMDDIKSLKKELEAEFAKKKDDDVPSSKKKKKVMECLIRNNTLDDVNWFEASDKLAFFFNDVRARANCDVLQPLVYPAVGYHPLLKVFGWILVLQWHVRFRFSRVIRHFFCPGPGTVPKDWKPLCTWRKVGLNIVILMTWFGPHRNKERPLVMSMIYIFTDTVVLYYGMGILYRYIRKACDYCQVSIPLEREIRNGELDQSLRGSGSEITWQFDLDETMNAADEAEDDGNAHNKSTITSKYEDITLKLRRVVPIFAVQFVLITMYIQQLNIGGDPDNDVDIQGAREDITKVDPIRWLAAVMLQMYCGDDQTGEAFSMSLWMKFLGETFSKWGAPRTWEILKFHDKDDGDIESLAGMSKVRTYLFHILPATLSTELNVRCFMDFCINGVGRSIIMYTFPIMLSVEGPLDFVKDCTAVLFISQLDDLNDPKNLKEVIIKRKVALKQENAEGGYQNADLEFTGKEKAYVREHMDAFEKLTDYELIDKSLINSA